MEKRLVGRLGERVAAIYLKRRKYKLWYMNFRRPWGELDIVSRSPEGVLVFTEVKSSIVNDFRYSMPEDHMTDKKIRNLRKIAVFFANQYDKLSSEGWRIDFISVLIPEAKAKLMARLPDILLTRMIKYCVIEFTPNI
ncbi:MAG: YraN family protein [Patescibacteria group bacterium]|nr:YraN family protein [Patescibacteria group bacterium]